MNAQSFPALVDNLSCPDVQAGLLDGYISAPLAYHQKLRKLPAAQSIDLVSEAIAYRESWRGAWESSPDGIAAWLLAQESEMMSYGR